MQLPNDTVFNELIFNFVFYEVFVSRLENIMMFFSSLALHALRFAIGRFFGRFL